MTSLRKLVIINRIEGAITRTVSITRRFKLVTNCSGLVGALNERLTVGIESAPKKKTGNSKRVKNMLFFNYFSCFFISKILF